MSVDPNDPALRLIRSCEYRFGFSPVAAMSFVLAGTLVVLQPDNWWLGALVAVASSCFLFVRYHRWRGRPWRKVHNRGMLLWAAACGRSDGLGSHTIAAKLRAFATLLKVESPSLDPAKTMAFLEASQGQYVQNLFEAHRDRVWGPGAQLEELQPTLARLHSSVGALISGEHLILMRVIEETYGWQEAVEYALALTREEAR